MPSAHDEYRTDPEVADAISELSKGFVLLDPFCGRVGQPSLIDADVRIYRQPGRPRVRAGAFAVDWVELLLEEAERRILAADDEAEKRNGLVSATRIIPSTSWRGSVRVVDSLDLGHGYSNPPYSNPLQKQSLYTIAKYAERGLWQTALVPSSTGSAAFQHCYLRASQVCFLRGRRRFWQHPMRRKRGRRRLMLSRSPSPARFDSAILHFCGADRARMERFLTIFERFGVVQDLGRERAAAILHPLFARPRLPVAAGSDRPPVRIKGMGERRKARVLSLANRQDGQAAGRSQQHG